MLKKRSHCSEEGLFLIFIYKLETIHFLDIRSDSYIFTILRIGRK